MRALTARWQRSAVNRFLFEPQSPSPAALLRIAWGLTAALWAVTLLPDVDPFLKAGALRYEISAPPGSWNPLDWITWSGAPMAATVLLIAAGLATAVGYRTRFSAAVSVLLLMSLIRTNSTVFNAGEPVLRTAGEAVFLAPSGLLLSLDAIRRRGSGKVSDTIRRAPWALRLLQLQIAVGYFVAAWAKLRGTTWNSGNAVGLVLRIEDLRSLAAPQWLLNQAFLLNLATWGTVLFEGTFLFLVWNRRLRPWVLGVGVVFHVIIHVYIDVGFFSIAMLITYLAFIPPDVADRWVARIDSLLRLPRRPASDPSQGTISGTIDSHHSQ